MTDTRLLTPAQVAAIFKVDPKSVTRWVKRGKLTAVRTIGGHRRYLVADVRQHLIDLGYPRQVIDALIVEATR